MRRTRSSIRVAVIGAAAAALVGIGLAAPAAAQGNVAAGVLGPGSGRTGANVAAGVALIAVVVGGLALARSGGRNSTGNVRGAAVAALALGPTGMVPAALHLATNTGAIGTGSGRLGAIVALVLGLIGTVLGGRALGRSRGPG